MFMHSIAMVAGLGMVLLPGVASAGSYGSNESSRYTDYAEVVHVEPIYRTVQISTPREECWDQPVTRYRQSYGHGRSYTPAILGGIAGGVIGNQFGGGTGNTLLTVAGVLLGGSIGNDHARHYTSQPYTTTERRCEVSHSYHQEERLDGYRVEYRYQGRLYTTRMDQRPGDRLRVSIQVAPEY